ncbi:MAG: hypothetical protein COA42_05625 [Alteromonadaceae bacterium]|nr:MAG: hypothetical protein COA42_05625 [Alteromonadaceae bacterium]
MNKITDRSKGSALSMSDLDERVTQLGHEGMPNRDLWPGIEQAINPRDEVKESWFTARLPRFVPASIAMTALSITTTAAVLIILNFIPRQTEQPQNTVYQYEMENAIRALERSYQSETQQMLVRYQSRPALTDNWQQQLQDLHEARQTVISAMLESPENMQFIRMLKNIHQQELMIIERSHERELDSI